MSSIPEWLTELGIPAACISQLSSVAEKGRSFAISPQDKDQIWQIKVDDCWIPGSDEKKIDYLFWVQGISGHRWAK